MRGIAVVGMVLSLILWPVLGWSQDSKEPTPGSVKRELQWTRRDHAACKQALAEVWDQGDVLEKQVKELTAKVQALEAEVARLTLVPPIDEVIKP